MKSFSIRESVATNIWAIRIEQRQTIPVVAGKAVIVATGQ